MPAEYRDDLLDWCERRFADDPFLARGQMMGHPGWKLVPNGRFFLLCYEDGLALKMPPERYEGVLRRDDVRPFQPGGMARGMGTWVVWSCPELEQYDAAWELFIVPSRNHVAAEPPNTPRRRKR